MTGRVIWMVLFLYGCLAFGAELELLREYKRQEPVPEAFYQSYEDVANTLAKGDGRAVIQLLHPRA